MLGSFTDGSRALLEVVALRLATHADAIEDYVRHTLLYHTTSMEGLKTMVDSTIQEHVTAGLLVVDDTGSFKATPLSKAIVASGLAPDDGIYLHKELERALKAFVMDGEMHIFYTFTPIHSSLTVDIDWSVFRSEMENLDESGIRVLRFVGINPAFVNQMFVGACAAFGCGLLIKDRANAAKALPDRTPEEISRARTYRRFYAALQLRDLCNEVPVGVVAQKFHVSRGFVQALAETCEGFAAGLIQFCHRMEWGMLGSALEHMVDRLKAGAKADLLDLASIPFVKSRTARLFWDNGFKSLSVVAEADPHDLVPVLILVRIVRSVELPGANLTAFRLNRGRSSLLRMTKSNTIKRCCAKRKLLFKRPIDYGVCIGKAMAVRQVERG